MKNKNLKLLSKKFKRGTAKYLKDQSTVLNKNKRLNTFLIFKKLNRKNKKKNIKAF